MKVTTIFIFLLILLIGSILLFNNPHLSDNSEYDPCKKESQDSYGQLRCYSEQAHTITQAHGIQAALEFTQDVIRKNSVFGYTHMVMHVIGRDAYALTHDFKKTLAYAPMDPSHEGYFYHDDGYSHGVYQAYFAEEKDKKSALELMRNVCSEYFDDQSRIVQDGSDGWLPFRECFHAIGHALMYMNENDVMKSLKHCDELFHPYMQQWCYYGVFMENSYLYIPMYEPRSPRPFVTPNTFVPLCERVEERYRGQCANFVGRAFIQSPGGNIEGAFQQCFLLEEKHEKRCIEHIAWLFVPLVFKGDFPGMIETCKKAGPKHKTTCIMSLAVGIGRGSGGMDEPKNHFCDFVDSAMRQKCLEAIEKKVLSSDHL